MDKRELLMEFVMWLGEKPDGDVAVHGSWKERGSEIVDRFLASRGGALGFSEDELKGTARETWSVVVDGAPLTQAKAIELGGDAAVWPMDLSVNEARGISRASADAIFAWLDGRGTAAAIVRDDLSRPARMN